jgi:Kef-type K+ transport system membrane component KefB
MIASTSLLLWIAVLLLAANLAGHLSQQVGLPRVFGKLIVGLLLGPAVLRVVPLTQSLQDMANIGVVILMFVAGVETDLVQMRRVGVAAGLAAWFGVLFPLAAGTVLSFAFGFKLYSAIFVGTVLTATSVSISAQTLQELGQLKTKIGSTILGAAIIDDVLGILVLAVVTALGGESGSYLAVIKLLVFLPAAFFVGHFIVPLVVRRLDLLGGKDVQIAVLLALVLAFSWAAAQLGGLAAITGAYLAGVFVGRTHIRSEASELVSFLGYAFFIPLFFASVGMAVRLEYLRAAPLFAASIIVAAILTKVLGCFMGALMGRFSIKESGIVGIGMISRGEVALVIATIGLQSGVIGSTEFSVAVLMTVATTLITPILLKAAIGKSASKEQRIERTGLQSDLGLLDPPMEV